DGAGNMFGGGCRKLYEFAARRFQREAMFIVAAAWIRAERGNADAVFSLDRLRVPGARRAVRFRRHPALDMPAVDRGILRFLPQFNALSQQPAVFVAILELAADPREAVPAPHGAVVGLAETIRAAVRFETTRDCIRRFVRFASHEDHEG